jgi:hypothetical protein
MIKQNEIKVLLMANVHGGNLHHPDTSRAGALGPIFIINRHYILKKNASSAQWQWTSQQL